MSVCRSQQPKSFWDPRQGICIGGITAEQQLDLYECIHQLALQGTNCDLVELRFGVGPTVLFLDVDMLRVPPGAHEAFLVYLITCVRDVSKTILGLGRINILVACPPSGRGAHIFVLNEFWGKVIVTPKTRRRVFDAFDALGLSSMIDRSSNSVRLLGAAKFSPCKPCQATRKRRRVESGTAARAASNCALCHGKGRVDVGDPYTLLYAVEPTGSILDLTDLRLDVALDLTRITWFEDIDGPAI